MEERVFYLSSVSSATAIGSLLDGPHVPEFRAGEDASRPAAQDGACGGRGQAQRREEDRVFHPLSGPQGGIRLNLQGRLPGGGLIASLVVGWDRWAGWRVTGKGCSRFCIHSVFRGETGFPNLHKGRPVGLIGGLGGFEVPDKNINRSPFAKQPLRHDAKQPTLQSTAGLYAAVEVVDLERRFHAKTDKEFLPPRTPPRLRGDGVFGETASRRVSAWAGREWSGASPMPCRASS